LWLAALAAAFFLGVLVDAALAGEPKFHMGDKVRVTKGFYRGCVNGTVVDILPASNTASGKDEYMVEDFVCRNGATRSIIILAEDLLALELQPS